MNYEFIEAKIIVSENWTFKIKCDKLYTNIYTHI